MPSSRKLLILVAFIATASLAIAQQGTDARKKARSDFLKQREATKPAPAKAEKKPKTTPEPEEKKPLSKLSLPLPKGYESKDVVIPYTDGTGKKSMVFRIGVGMRLDEDHVNMSNLLIEMFDEGGQQEMTIELPSSQLNLSNRTISGNKSVTIKRSDFQLTGQNMEFNTETKQGWIKGNVKMIIFDLAEKTGEGAPKKEGKGS
jgi:hypothetical protein